jgi:hypothetical protein
MQQKRHHYAESKAPGAPDDKAGTIASSAPSRARAWRSPASAAKNIPPT